MSLKKRTDSRNGGMDTFAVENLLDTFPNSLPLGFEKRVDLFGMVFQVTKHRQSSSRCQWVGRKGSSADQDLFLLVHLSLRGRLFENILFPCDHPHREASSNDLSEGGEIRRDAKPSLCAVQGNPESCDDFVKNQKGSHALCFIAKHLQVVERGGHKTAFTDDGFQDDSGQGFPGLTDYLSRAIQGI